MNKLLFKIIAVVVFCCCLACIAVACQEAPVTKTADGLWRYTLNVEKDENGTEIKTVTLDEYLGDAAEVIVPAKIDVDGTEIAVTKLGDEAFRKIDDGKGKWRDRETYAKNLTLKKITIEEGVTSIGGMAFYLCSELNEVNLPESMESIGDFAFFGCASLQSITLPKNVNYIGAYSFRACENLKTVNVLAEAALPKIGDKAFYLVDNNSSDDDQYYIIPNLKINVPASAIGLYDADAIEANRKQTKKNDYRYWTDYITAGCIAAIQG